MPEDQEVIYDFCDEFHRNQSVSDAISAKALAKFGERGISISLEFMAGIRCGP